MRKLCCVILMTVLMALLPAASLAGISLPEGVTDIGAEAFAGDASLTGLLKLPQDVTSIGSRAFAGTGLHGVVVPAGCQNVASDAFSGSDVVYVLFEGAATQVDGGFLKDVSLVFAPAGSGVTAYCNADDLVRAGGVIYRIEEDVAMPLCLVDPTDTTGAVTIPKFVEGIVVMTLGELDLTGFREPPVVPTYLKGEADDLGFECQTQSWMTITAPVADLAEAAAGENITWTTSVEGAYGPISYLWTFDVDGVLSSEITIEPSVTWTSATAGECLVTVQAVDKFCDEAEATSETAVTFTAPNPVYRALLIGNIYAADDEDIQLHGPTTDVAAVRSVLASMTGTPFSVTTKIDLTKPGILSAITSAFSGAKEGDVSLFYYSGHGSSDGSLVGTDHYGLSANDLRQKLDTVPGTKILIFDSCYSGAMIGKSNSVASPAAFNSAIISAFSSFSKDNLAANNYIVLTAASGSETSQELYDENIHFGAFTYGLCYGSGYDEWNQCAISGLPADSNSDQAISLGEAKVCAQEKISWLMDMVGAEVYNVQTYGDSSYVLWSK